MYRRRKKITKKTVIIGIVVVILMISLSILLPRNNYINNSILKDITITINKIVMFPFTTLNTEKNINHNESYLIQKNVNESLEKEIQELMIDDDVTNKKGIYIYVLTRNEKYLNIRAFTDNQKRSAYERQQGICKTCGKHFDIKEMEADHITPWHAGGQTNAENCQMLCRECNRRKSGK